MAIKPPRPKGPPLNAMRAFEAAARLGGFTNAAEELCVTQGAVAQQIKTLESWAGAPLFERKAQGVVLSRVGQQVLPSVIEAFDAMGQAVLELQQAASPHRIHIAALPAVAQLWLSPRLPELRAMMPEIEISVTALEQAPNLAREPFDLALFYGANADQDIVRDRIFPVCTPALGRKVTSVADLKGVPCLSDAVWADDWALWLRTKAPQEDVIPRGPVYSLYALAVEEALNGAGVLMAHEALVQRHLESGALIAPFEGAVETGQTLGMQLRDGKPRPALAALIKLLLSESSL
ncbi:LysR substrate-binding domain-containing protein [Shimia thalassica]|uniref:LysR substrate-binding domain-containing protein n=1 Tax=Shimia thalassica TaxID=1715693 RepID=UPI002736C26F|nr:LysR substrate-binding domain-containing protein [Shimia thalassica]MDP2493205.1 LysR substrate-binding domain-containing protein [Shimia thalassica]